MRSTIVFLPRTSGCGRRIYLRSEGRSQALGGVANILWLLDWREYLPHCGQKPLQRRRRLPPRNVERLRSDHSDHGQRGIEALPRRPLLVPRPEGR